MKKYYLLSILLGFLFSCNNDKIPNPTGSFKVGTVNFELRDDSRKEIFSLSKDEKRRFMVRAWYPTDDVSGCKAYPWTDNDMAYALNKYMGFPKFAFNENDLSRSFVDAPVSKKKSSYPIIIFNHGYASDYLQNFSQMEDLASNGFVVFSINHTYESIISVFPDGKKIELSQTLPYYKVATNNNLMKKNIKKAQKIFDSIRNSQTIQEKINCLYEIGKIDLWKNLNQSINVWIDDTNFLIESIKHNKIPAKLKNVLDIDRIGIYGHSFGGLVAGELCMMNNDIKAGINLDGLQIQYDRKKQLKLLKPFLFFYSTTNNCKGFKLNYQDQNDGIFLNSDNPVYTVTINGTAHMNYSDLTYISILKFMGIIGPADGKKAGILQNSYILAFFNKYLKGIDSPLLKEVPKQYSEEIILKSRNIIR